MHVDGNARLLQAVAGHEDATVVLHHALSVAIDVMQRQHHSHADGALAHVVGSNSRLHRLCGYNRRALSTLAREWDPDDLTLLQLEVRGLHLRIRLNQLVDGDLILAGDAEDGLLALHLVQATYLFSHLCHRRVNSEENCQNQQKIS